MELLNARQEWKILNFEVFKNRPKDAPYPEHISNRRGLLLFAQYLLAAHQSAKRRKYKNFFGELYRKIMETYFVGTHVGIYPPASGLRNSFERAN